MFVVFSPLHLILASSMKLLYIYTHSLIYIDLLTGCTKNEPGDQKKGDAPAKLPHEEDEEQQSSTSTAAEELQLLDEILSRAQKLRAVQPSEVRNTAFPLDYGRQFLDSGRTSICNLQYELGVNFVLQVTNSAET